MRSFSWIDPIFGLKRLRRKTFTPKEYIGLKLTRSPLNHINLTRVLKDGEILCHEAGQWSGMKRNILDTRSTAQTQSKTHFRKPFFKMVILCGNVWLASRSRSSGGREARALPLRQLALRALEAAWPHRKMKTDIEAGGLAAQRGQKRASNEASRAFTIKWWRLTNK